MTKEEAVKLLEALTDDDPERSHMDADRILVEFLIESAPEVALAYCSVSNRVGFWYA